MKKILFIVVLFILAQVFNPAFVRANFTPAPAADFYPVFGNSSSTNFIDISFNLSANGHPGLVNKNLSIVPVICNGISISPWNDCEIDAHSMTTAYLNDAYGQTSVTFSNLALYYLGNNYITCYVYDPSTENGDFCGAEHYSTHSYFDYKEVNYTGGLLPVYRFWSNTKNHHFFTIDHGEKWSIQSNYDEDVWKYEQPAFFAYRSEVCIGSPVYRFWSNTKQGHFYTIDLNERNFIIANYPSNVWNYEGIAYCAQTSATTSTPVYRFWSDTMQGHFYTVDEGEKNFIIANYPSNVWNYEGIAFWAYL